MDQIKDILAEFDSISLNEMDSVKFMNRTDVKFIFNASRLQDILGAVKPFYSCLNIESSQLSRYHTLYYDTGELSLYKKHHNGELNRYKIRHRSYIDSGGGFLEVKFKNNKGRTIKSRIKCKAAELTFGESSIKFLASELNFDPEVLRPVVQVNYKRITLVNKNSPERVTIDLDLQFVAENKEIVFSDLVIAEVKQDRKVRSPFVSVLKKHKIREGSFSKYCMAIALTRRDVKLNNFREKLYSLKNITNHDSISDCIRRR